MQHCGLLLNVYGSYVLVACKHCVPYASEKTDRHTTASQHSQMQTNTNF